MPSFEDLFPKKRKIPVRHETDEADPREADAKKMVSVVAKYRPALEEIVKQFRKMTGMQEFDIVMMVDGAPSNFHITNSLPKEIASSELLRQAGVPDNLPGVASAPKEDLIASIEALLRHIYKVEDMDVLGAVYSPHHSAAFKIGEILTKARDRDRVLISKEIEKLLTGFRY